MEKLFTINYSLFTKNGDGVYSAWVLLGIDPDNIQKRSKQNSHTNADTNKVSNFIVYPNPANESITIDYTGDITLLQKCQIEFYDIYGKLIKTEVLCKNSQTLNINDLSPGLYIYRITNFNSILQKNKLIKMN